MDGALEGGVALTGSKYGDSIFFTVKSYSIWGCLVWETGDEGRYD